MSSSLKGGLPSQVVHPDAEKLLAMTDIANRSPIQYADRMWCVLGGNITNILCKYSDGHYPHTFRTPLCH